MMKALKIIPIFFLIFFSCSAQEKQNKTEQNAIKPDENISVNKEFDEHGNLIKYDSIYSYSYSSNGKVNDSIKLQFQKHFNQHSIFSDSFFDDFFGSNSEKRQFNQNDFFFNGFMNQDAQIKSMMKRMDSIQQLFFNQHSKSIIPAEPEDAKPNTENINFKPI